MAGMITFLLATAIVCQDDRAAAIAKAQVEYKAVLKDTERRAVEFAITHAKRHMAEVSRATIDPNVRGLTAAPIFKSNGQVIGYSIQFPDAEQKRAAIAEAKRAIERAEGNLDLWKNGAYHPMVDVPELNPGKLSIGQVGPLPSGALVGIDANGKTAMLRFLKVTAPVIIDNIDTTRIAMMREGDSVSMPWVFWISGKRTIGKQVMFVAEPLEVDDN